jgi:hypothetical protein
VIQRALRSRGQGARPGWRIVLASSYVSALFAGATCGGTTGREGLDEPTGDTLDASASAASEAAMTDLDADLFDVAIPYADRFIPDVAAPLDTGVQTYAFPACPPFIPVDSNGNPVPFGAEIDQIPGVTVDAGLEAPAPDGSACATYGWLGSPAIDHCLTSSASGWGQGDFALLPPCNWVAEAGTASQGSGAGVAIQQLCISLYLCAMRTGCGAGGASATCLCGGASAAECIVDALSNYTQIDPAFIGYGGSALNYVFQNARTNACFQGLDAGTSE